MAVQLFSISPDRLASQAEAAVTAASTAAASEGVVQGEFLYGVWEDEAGAPVGDPFEIGRVERVMLEHPSGDGGFGRTEVSTAATFLADTPEEAAQLVIGTAVERVARLARADLEVHVAGLPAPRTELVGTPGSRFVFPVIAERFAAWESFLAKVEELRAWIVQQPPFNEDAVRTAFGLRAIFWPSDSVTGMFGADDSRAPANGQLFYGNQALAKQLIDPWLDNPNRPSLILINSTKRGGAGGSPGYSAWASIADGPLEDWQAIGLHEIGHALGLGDEYLLEALASQNPAILEPNISRVPTAGQAPWSTRITVPPTASPSHDLAHQPGDPAAIGTFQGARYRTDFYRPMQNCLMRDTRAQFCRICRDHIRATI